MKVFINSIFILGWVLLFNQTAFAYLDGGTGSVILQTLFAGVAGILAIVKLYWYKIKTFFSKLMHNTSKDANNSVPTDSKDNEPKQ